MEKLNGKLRNLKSNDSKKLANIVACLEALETEIENLGCGDSAILLGASRIALEERLKTSGIAKGAANAGLVSYFLSFEK